MKNPRTAGAPDSASVVLKIASRCNLNCTYCYVYNGRDDAWRNQPRFISEEIVAQTVRFLSDAPDVGLERLQFVFHGGEPTLTGPARFDGIVSAIREGLAHKLDVSFAMQTNATLITDEWIDVLSRHDVAVGVSLDGPKELNDRARLTLTSKGSYDAAAAGIARLVAARDERRISSVGLLCVIVPPADPRALLDHFVDDLGVHVLDFLLPDLTHEDAIPAGIGDYLVNLFDAWTARNDPRVRIRILSSVLSVMLGGRSRMIGFGGESPLAITINVDGTISPDDVLRNCGHGVMDTGHTVGASTLASLVASDAFRRIREPLAELPTGCTNCEWAAVCGGGHLVNRYSPENEFNNPSVLCGDLKQLYAHVARYVIAHGHLDRLRDALVLGGPARNRAAATPIATAGPAELTPASE